MSWSISTNGLEIIDSYKRAKEIWDTTEPWKNENGSWRPLAERRARHKRLEKVTHAGIDGYACVLYHTALVTYYADGSVDLQTHESVSSRAFTDYVHPPLCSMHHTKGLSYWTVMTDKGPCYYHQSRQPLHLTRTRAGNWRLLDKIEPRREWVNITPKIRETNKRLKVYETWAEMTARLSGHRPRRSFSLLLSDEINQLLAGKPEAFMKAYDLGYRIEDIKHRAHELTGARVIRPVPFTQPPKVPA